MSVLYVERGIAMLQLDNNIIKCLVLFAGDEDEVKKNYGNKN